MKLSENIVQTLCPQVAALDCIHLQNCFSCVASPPHSAWKSYLDGPIALTIIAAGVTIAVIAFLNQGRRKRRRRRTTPTWSTQWSRIQESVRDSLPDIDFPDFEPLDFNFLQEFDFPDFDFFPALDLPEFDFEHTVVAQGRTW